MKFEDLTIKEARELARIFKSDCASEASASPVVFPASAHDSLPIIVCTDKSGVVFGYCENVELRPITLKNARMALYWSVDIGGVFGLAEKGPTATCKISAVVPSITLEGVTAIMSVDSKAEKAWNSIEVQGRQ